MIYIFMTAIIFAVEYFVKKHMDKVRTLQEQRPLVGGKVILKKYYNTAAAGNFLKGHPTWVRYLHGSALAFVFVGLLYLMPDKQAAPAKTGLSFLAGGGLSNLHDRLVKGHVVDYVSFGFGPKRFQKLVFNMADFFVFAGVVICMVHYIRKERNF